MGKDKDARRPGTLNTRVDAVSRLLAHLQGGVPRTLVALVGLPGAGKSTLAAEIATEVNARTGPNTMLALSMDGFHLTRAQLQRMPDPALAEARRGAPWTFDPAALAARLDALRTGAGANHVPWPDFQHDIGDPVEAAFHVPPDARLVLVEGLYLLHRDDGWAPIGERFDERWYLDTPMEVAMDRLVRRHMAAWRWPREAAEQRIATNDRINAETVQRSRPHADFLLVPTL